MKLGAYTLINKIAQGGVADIYLAKGRTINGQDKYLVCKCIRDSLSGDVEFLTSIMNEIQFSTRLQHPNVIDIFDFCSCDGKAFLVMEYMDANNFHHLLTKNAELWDRVPPNIAIYAIGQAALGIHAAHEMTDNDGNPLHLVHRDISPENILFSSNGAIKISDFGIAKTCKMPNITAEDVVKGKVNYMSPEQAWADKIDRRSDLYSLAIVLYEALLGVRFNPADSFDEALNRARMAFFEIPRNIDPNFPEDLEKVLLKALDLDKNMRYDTVLDFKLALDECMNNHHWTVSVDEWIEYLKSHTDFPGHPLPLLKAGEIQPDSTSVLKPALEKNLPFSVDENATCRFSPDDLICALQRDDILPSSLSDLVESDGDSSKTEMLEQPACFRQNVDASKAEPAPAPSAQSASNNVSVKSVKSDADKSNPSAQSASNNVSVKSVKKAADKSNPSAKATKQRPSSVKIVYAKTVAIERPSFLNDDPNAFDPRMFEDDGRETVSGSVFPEPGELLGDGLDRQFEDDGCETVSGSVFPEAAPKTQHSDSSEAAATGRVSVRKGETTGEFNAISGARLSGRLKKIIIVVALILLAIGLFVLKIIFGE